MSRSKKHGKSPGTDLWKPGPMSGYAHSSKNKTIARRRTRKQAKRQLGKESHAD